MPRLPDSRSNPAGHLLAFALSDHPAANNAAWVLLATCVSHDFRARAAMGLAFLPSETQETAARLFDAFDVELGPSLPGEAILELARVVEGT